MNYLQVNLPSDNTVTLYIRRGPKISSYYGLAAHTATTVKNKTTGKRNPSQSSLYLGMYDTYKEAEAELNKLLERDKVKPIKLIGWKQDPLWRLSYEDRNLVVERAEWQEGPYEFFKTQQEALDRSFELEDQYPKVIKTILKDE